MKRALVSISAFALGMGIILSAANSQPPEGREPRPEKGDKGDKGGREPGPPPRYELGQVFPPPLMDEMKLTTDQFTELEKIQKDLKGKLDKLLTDDQKKVVLNFRPRGPGPGGPGGPGGDKGPPRGEKGPPKGEKGEKGGERPGRAPVEK